MTAGSTTGPITPLTIADRIAREGWAVSAPCVPQLTLDRVLAELEPLSTDADTRRGVPNLFELAPTVRALAASPCVRDVAEAVLGQHCFAVGATLFDKTPASWKVAWQQEVTIPVRERVIVSGFGPWSEVAGVQHVLPPVELLERMLIVRVHLDDSGPDNGPVRVLPGSHRVGRLTPSLIESYRAGVEPVDCIAERGGILAMRPLILHASSPARRPGHRRVVHFDFAAERLPAPLEWHDEVA